MKIIHKDIKKGELKIQITNQEDLWYLSHIIDGGDENQKVVRKSVFLKLRIERVEFHKYSDVLRVSGLVMEGPEDVAHGAHHTFNVDVNTILKIEKAKWYSYQLEKLEEATKNLVIKILLIIFDREESIFAMIKNREYEVLTKIKGDVAKKGLEGEKKANFYKALAKQIEEYDKRYKLENIIVASPGFWKEYLIKELSAEIKKKITLSTCSDVNESNIDEVMKRPELKTVLEKDRVAKELKLVDKLLEHISKSSACYGIKECQEKVEQGAVKDILISDNLMIKARKEENFEKIDALMKLCESMKGKIHIISSEDAAKKLDGLGGIAGILRWQSN